eukprot:6738383-Pyramimonas_sp.AAC.1
MRKRRRKRRTRREEEDDFRSAPYPPAPLSSPPDPPSSLGPVSALNPLKFNVRYVASCCSVARNPKGVSPSSFALRSI